MIRLFLGDGALLVLELSGTLVLRDLERALPMLKDELADRGSSALLIDLSELAGTALTAVARDLVFGAGLVGDLIGIERAAVVADPRWRRRLADVKTALQPDVEVRAFALGQRARAERWARDGVERPRSADVGRGSSMSSDPR